MGYYIDTLYPKDKADQICEVVEGAQIVEQPMSFFEVPSEMGLICIVDNGPFEAAGFCYSEQEFEEFCRPDGRKKTWLLMDRKTAEDLSGFPRGRGK